MFFKKKVDAQRWARHETRVTGVKHKAVKAIKHSPTLEVTPGWLVVVDTEKRLY